MKLYRTSKLIAQYVCAFNLHCKASEFGTSFVNPFFFPLFYNIKSEGLLTLEHATYEYAHEKSNRFLNLNRTLAKIALALYW